jgi:hypothetical protein
MILWHASTLVNSCRPRHAQLASRPGGRCRANALTSGRPLRHGNARARRRPQTVRCRPSQQSGRSRRRQLLSTRPSGGLCATSFASAVPAGELPDRRFCASRAGRPAQPPLVMRGLGQERGSPTVEVCRQRGGCQRPHRALDKREPLTVPVRVVALHEDGDLVEGEAGPRPEGEGLARIRARPHGSGWRCRRRRGQAPSQGDSGVRAVALAPESGMPVAPSSAGAVRGGVAPAHS